MIEAGGFDSDGKEDVRKMKECGKEKSIPVPKALKTQYNIQYHQHSKNSMNQPFTLPHPNSTEHPNTLLPSPLQKQKEKMAKPRIDLNLRP